MQNGDEKKYAKEIFKKMKNKQITKKKKKKKQKKRNYEIE